MEVWDTPTSPSPSFESLDYIPSHNILFNLLKPLTLWQKENLRLLPPIRWNSSRISQEVRFSGLLRTQTPVSSSSLMEKKENLRELLLETASLRDLASTRSRMRKEPPSSSSLRTQALLYCKV